MQWKLHEKLHQKLQENCIKNCTTIAPEIANEEMYRVKSPLFINFTITDVMTFPKFKRQATIPGKRRNDANDKMWRN